LEIWETVLENLGFKDHDYFIRPHFDPVSTFNTEIHFSFEKQFRNLLLFIVVPHNHLALRILEILAGADQGHHVAVIQHFYYLYAAVERPVDYFLQRLSLEDLETGFGADGETT
jgi:hypothetical protein